MDVRCVYLVGFTWSCRLYHRHVPFSWSCRLYHRHVPFSWSCRLYHRHVPFSWSCRLYHRHVPFTWSCRLYHRHVPFTWSCRLYHRHVPFTWSCRLYHRNINVHFTASMINVVVTIYYILMGVEFNALIWSKTPAVQFFLVESINSVFCSVFLKVDQKSCFLTHTNAATHQIVNDGMHLNKHVMEEITGPRYKSLFSSHTHTQCSPQDS